MSDRHSTGEQTGEQTVEHAHSDGAHTSEQTNSHMADRHSTAHKAAWLAGGTTDNDPVCRDEQLASMIH